MSGVLEARTQLLGMEHPDVGSNDPQRRHHPHLAGLYREQDQYAKAQSLYERALAVRETALGPDHPAVANSLNNLALLYDNQGLYVEGRAPFTNGLWRTWKRPCLQNYALCLRAMDRSQEAEPLEARAMAIRAKSV
jgi:tetratricopeptide (TPR) repeat protein